MRGSKHHFRFFESSRSVAGWCARICGSHECVQLYTVYQCRTGHEAESTRVPAACPPVVPFWCYDCARRTSSLSMRQRKWYASLLKTRVFCFDQLGFVELWSCTTCGSLQTARTNFDTADSTSISCSQPVLHITSSEFSLHGNPDYACAVTTSLSRCFRCSH